MLSRLLILSLGSLAASIAANAQTFTGPSTTESFGDAIKGFKLIRNYVLGGSRESTIRSLDDLADKFTPYGIGGTTVINQEWQRYQPFNPDASLIGLQPTSLSEFPSALSIAHIKVWAQ
jgi:hypothetical protein